MCRKLLFGCIAGIISRTFTAPIDRLKVMAQALPPGTKSVSLLTSARNIYQSCGFRGFFRGNLTNCVKVAPDTAIRYYSFERFKKLVAHDTKDITLMERFISGGLAGSFTQAIVYPLEVVKTRMNLSKPGTYSSIRNCIVLTIRNEGYFAMYKGCFTSVSGIIPYAGIDLMVNSMIKDKAIVYYNSKGFEPPIAVVIAGGIISSSIGMLLTYPINLLRTRLQVTTQ